MTGKAATTDNTGKIWSIIGMVFAVVALIFFPIVFGPIGAICGVVGHVKGDRPRGMIVVVAAVVATVIGIALGAAILSNR